MARTPNTLQAHRLIWLAGEKGLQDGAVEALFRAYFTEGRDVSDTSVLIEIAARAGIDKEHASAFFNGTVGTDEVRFEAQTAMSRRISGVPTLILDGEAIFSGALKPDLMAARLREAVFAHERQ
jgi:predicted DsbA family dithiol-disulfide isomerase